MWWQVLLRLRLMSPPTVWQKSPVIIRGRLVDTLVLHVWVGHYIKVAAHHTILVSRVNAVNIFSRHLEALWCNFDVFFRGSHTVLGASPTSMISVFGRYNSCGVELSGGLISRESRYHDISTKAAGNLPLFPLRYPSYHSSVTLSIWVIISPVWSKKKKKTNVCIKPSLKLRISKPLI